MTSSFFLSLSRLKCTTAVLARARVANCTRYILAMKSLSLVPRVSHIAIKSLSFLTNIAAGTSSICLISNQASSDISCLHFSVRLIIVPNNLSY
jgi:hypothetical protein